jgi:hypothetical protein
VYRNANCAATGAIRRGRMNVSRFQPAKDEDQQDAAQGNPAPEPARRELSSMDDTHSPVFSPVRNIARVHTSINRARYPALPTC